MNPKTLYSILSGGETATVEFKLDSVRNEHLAKELGAMANFRGGMLVLGVDTKGNVAGLTREDNEERLQNICYNFEPPIQIATSEIQIQKKMVITATIVENHEKPYAYKSQTRNIYYIRSGSVSREATRSELRRMFQQSGELHYELLTLQNASAETLNDPLLFSFFREFRFINLEDYSENELQIVLNNLSILNGAKTSFLGQLLFGKNPRRFIPGSGVQVAVFKGHNNSSTVLDHRFFEGPLIEDVPLLLKYLSLHNPKGFDNIKNARQDIRKYPNEAVRESVINAICHRDYTIKGAVIQISLYDDRMEIISPGELPNTQTIEKIKMGMIYQRNPLTVQYFYDFRYVERLGRGIQKIMESMEANGNPPPEFYSGDGCFKVLLKNKPQQPNQPK